MNCRLLSPDLLEVTTSSSDETKALGAALGRLAYAGLALLLHGGLGLGKTTLAQGIGGALGFARIKSPSFIIVSEYGGELPLAHADLYRLESAQQAEELDLEAYLEDGFLLVVEWAERWKSAPLSDKLEIFFERGAEVSPERTIRIEASGRRAASILAELVKHNEGRTKL